MLGFERQRDARDFIEMGATVTHLSSDLDEQQLQRLRRCKRYWNFYEGYHWEEMPDVDTPEVTVNYCGAFVNKFVAFELGKGFTFTVHKDLADTVVTNDGRTLFEYLEDVWEDNSQFTFATELGQMKSVTGEAWVQVRYYSPDELDDPYNKYPEGRIKLLLQPTSVVFPEYDPHQKGVLKKVSIVYQYYDYEDYGIFHAKSRKVLRTYKQIWTKDKVVTYMGGKEPVETVNKYGVIPFIQVKNFILAGRNEGVSDIADIIPMNVEYNLKKSNVSEILDYHAAPVTLVFGAKIGNLEKGANKLWGGLPKDAKVQNLELNSDLGASNTYLENLKLEMCEVGGIPETVLGGAKSISNTSGVALQYMNLPLIEKTRVKRQSTEDGLERLHELIILISLLEGLIFKEDSIAMRDFVHTEVSLPDTLPKDTLIELQQIQQELNSGLESRRGALKRMGREDIDNKLREIDEERENNPELFGLEVPQDEPQLNSGFLNGQTPQEQMNIEKNGANINNPEIV